jgi:hypothetical protein
MSADSTGPEDQDSSEKELEEQFKEFQLSQQVYLQETFKWLIDFVASYFPEDHLAIRDMELEVHFVHRVFEDKKPMGALVYRFRKFINKKDYFAEMGDDYREGLDLPEVLFVDSETTQFTEPKSLETDSNYLEIPMEKLTGKMRELREELKRRTKIRRLRESL